MTNRSNCREGQQSQLYDLFCQIQEALTDLGGIWRYPANSLKVYGLCPDKESVLIDKVLHDLPFLPPHGHPLVPPLVQVVSHEKIGIRYHVRPVVKKVAPGKGRSGNDEIEGSRTLFFNFSKFLDGKVLMDGIKNITGNDSCRGESVEKLKLLP